MAGRIFLIGHHNLPLRRHVVYGGSNHEVFEAPISTARFLRASH
jgi:hypothetical protein